MADRRTFRILTSSQHPSIFHPPNNSHKGAQTKKLLITLFSSDSCYFLDLKCTYFPQHHILKKHPAISTTAKSPQNILRGVQGYQHVKRNPQPQDSIVKSICPSNRFERTNFNIILQSFHYIPPLNILLYTVHVNYIHKNHLLPHREHLAPITKTEL